MKLSEIRELTIEELNQQVENSRKELFEVRLKHAMSQLDNTSTLRTIKHRISQLKTVIQEKKLALVNGGKGK
jgi:large subunit ribosomal protein L29